MKVVRNMESDSFILSFISSSNCVGVCDSDIILDTFQWHANYFTVAMAMKLIIYFAVE